MSTIVNEKLTCCLDLSLSQTSYPYNDGRVKGGPEAELVGGG